LTDFNMRAIAPFTIACALAVACSALPSNAQDARNYASHRPVRELPPISQRPMTTGAAQFVDAARGSDTGDGSEKLPWKTIAFALTQLNAGDTLYLRGGVYYEKLHCSLVGTPDKPITIRSHPGERAIIDGGFHEFFDSPASAWTPGEN